MPSKRNTRLTQLATLSLGGAALVFLAPGATQWLSAEEPTTEERMRERREAEQRGEVKPGPSTTSALPRGNLPPLPPLERPDPNSREWLAAAETMKKHTPNWWGRFERFGAEAPSAPRVMSGIMERHRELERIRQRDPEQYKGEIEQLELEDEVLGVARQIRMARREGDEERGETLRKQLREKISKLVDVRLRNREARLQRLDETIKAERTRLEEAKRNRDAAIERNLQDVLSRPEGGVPGSPGNPLRGGERGRPDFAAPPRAPGDGDGGAFGGEGERRGPRERDRDRDRNEFPPPPPRD